MYDENPGGPFESTSYLAQPICPILLNYGWIGSDGCAN